MRLNKELNKSGGYIISVEVGHRGNQSYWTSPPRDIITFDMEYLRNRYPIINTKEKAEQFTSLYKNLWIEVNKEQLRLMKHMIGLNYHKKPYRNYGFFYKEVEELEQLVTKGLACKKEIENKGVNYHLTKQGVEFVLGKSISHAAYLML